jgi:hypothetical protein
MKKSVLLLSIVLLAFSASAQAYIGPGLIGTGTSMLMMPGYSPCLLVGACPSLLPVMIGGPSQLIMLHTTPILSVMPTHCVAPVLLPCFQPGSSVTVVGIQTAFSSCSAQDMVLSVITNHTN